MRSFIELDPFIGQYFDLIRKEKDKPLTFDQLQDLEDKSKKLVSKNLRNSCTALSQNATNILCKSDTVHSFSNIETLQNEILDQDNQCNKEKCVNSFTLNNFEIIQVCQEQQSPTDLEERYIQQIFKICWM